MSIFNKLRKKIKSTNNEHQDEEFIEESFSQNTNTERELYNIEITDAIVNLDKKIPAIKKDNIEIIEAMISAQNGLDLYKYTSVNEIVEYINKNQAEEIAQYINKCDVLDNNIKEKFESKEKCIESLNNSILSILYYIDAEGIDELLKLAVNGDEISLKAIKLLCKHAKENIEVDKIVDSIFYIMEGFNEEITLEILENLSSIKGNNKVEHILKIYFKNYVQQGDSINSYNIMLNLINNSSAYPKKYLRFLKSIALQDTYIRMNDILDDENEIITFKDIDKELSIKAAITYHSIYKCDKEINTLLEDIKSTHMDKEIKSYISDILQ